MCDPTPNPNEGDRARDGRAGRGKGWLWKVSPRVRGGRTTPTNASCSANQPRTGQLAHAQSPTPNLLYVCFGDTLCRVERHWVRVLGARHVTHRCSCAPCPQPHGVDIRVCQWLLLCVCNQRVATKEGMVNRHHRENSERERERGRSLRGEGRV